jgi:hypothetical protein
MMAGLFTEGCPMERIVITSLSLEGAGAKAGLRIDDVLVSYNKVPLNNLDALLQCLEAQGNGSAEIIVFRAGDVMPIAVPRGRLAITVKPAKFSENLIRQISSIKISISSGETFNIVEGGLINAERFNEARQLMATGNENFKGWTSPIGFIGDPSWVVMGSVLTHFMERQATKAMIADGQQQIGVAMLAMQALRHSSQFVSVKNIFNVQFPNPALWVGDGKMGETLVHGGESYLICRSDLAREVYLSIAQIAVYEPIYTD